MQAFGRMRLDVENCLKELVESGVVRRVAGDPVAYTAAKLDPASAQGKLLDTFLERRAAVGIEDTSPSVQRFREMIGRDEKMLVIFEWIRTAAKSDISVLILGPTGAGKEVVARMIHELSRRGTEKFQAVNCAALPDTLFESEIFGYEKGAFTGAHDRKPGRLELANGGTFFLDEIGDLSLVAQAKLLRVLEERRFERLGGSKSIHVDFRLISATNRPLDQFVRESRFREDLYYRVNAFSIRLPSLRERAVDIPVLAQRFLGRYCAANGLPLDAKRLSPEAADRLLALPLARQHPRAREHGVARRAVGARARSSAPRTSSSCTRRWPRRASHAGPAADAARRRARAHRGGARRGAAGTRTRPRGCSTSAAARSTGRSRSTASSPPPAAGAASRSAPDRPRDARRSPLPRRTYHRRRRHRRRGRRWRSRGRSAHVRLRQPVSVRRAAAAVEPVVGVQGDAAADGQRLDDVGVATPSTSPRCCCSGRRRPRSIAVTSAWSQCTFRMQPADRRCTARSSAWRRWRSRCRRPGWRLRAARRRARRARAIACRRSPRALVGAATTYFLFNTVLIVGGHRAVDPAAAASRSWNENFLWSAPSYFVGAGRRRSSPAWSVLQLGLLARRLLHRRRRCYLIYRTYKVYLGRIEDEQRHVQEMSDLHLATIEALALAIDAKDQTAQSHIRRVQVYAAGLARALGMSEQRDPGREDGRAAARHRQAGGARAHPVEARPAHPGGVPEDPHPPAGRRRDHQRACRSPIRWRRSSSATTSAGTARAIRRA